MPTYEYHCPHCLIFVDVTKSMNDAEAAERCPQCPRFLELVISVPRVNTRNCQFDAHYNWGLGKVIRSPAGIKEELRRIKGETGKEIVEVGNDTLKSIKKQRKAYTLDD